MCASLESCHHGFEREFSSCFTLKKLPVLSGVLAQRADEMLGGPPPKRWIQEPFVVRDRDGRHPRGPYGSALRLCV